VAEAEKLEVTEEEVDEVIREMAQDRRLTPAELKTRLTRDGKLDTLKSTRRNQKALDCIYHNAKIIRKSA
jgi:FKBP-type peptidyl-prolyl cis-trans isomerase (trigger factor)